MSEGGVTTPADHPEHLLSQLGAEVKRLRCEAQDAHQHAKEWEDSAASLRSELSRLREENERLLGAFEVQKRVKETLSERVASLRAKYEGEGAREFFGVYGCKGSLFWTTTDEAAARKEVRDGNARCPRCPATVVRFREVRE